MLNLYQYSSRRHITLSLLPANPSIVRNLRIMSIQDHKETDPLLFTQAQQAWIEHLIAAKISEAASTSTTTPTSDITAQVPPSSQLCLLLPKEGINYEVTGLGVDFTFTVKKELL